MDVFVATNFEKKTLTKSWSTSDDVGDLLPQLVSHEADDGEYDEPGKYGGGAVGEGNQDGIAVTVVAELVVGGQCDQPTKRGSQGVENLRCSI